MILKYITLLFVVIPDLGGIYEAEPVGFSFDTLAWKITGVILLLILSVLFYKITNKYLKNAYRRKAVKYLAEQSKSNDILNKTLIVLKSVAIKTYGRENVSQLSGLSWLEFLESKTKGIDFSGFEYLIVQNTYKNEAVSADDSEKFLQTSIKWIKTHYD